MATLDDICEAFDEFERSYDTPIIIRHGNQVFELDAITTEPDGTVIFELEES